MRTDIDSRKEEILQWIAEGKTKNFIFTQLRCDWKTLDTRLSKWGINYAGNQGGKGKTSSQRKTALDYLGQSTTIRSPIARRKLIEDGIKEHRCERCLRKTWNNKPIPIELNHIDGNRFNWSLDNLEILCPNCHAQESTSSGGNWGKYKS